MSTIICECGMYCLQFRGWRVSEVSASFLLLVWSTCSLILKMWAVNSPKTSVNFLLEHMA
jgi:hypothetical protein